MDGNKRKQDINDALEVIFTVFVVILWGLVLGAIYTLMIDLGLKQALQAFAGGCLVAGVIALGATWWKRRSHKAEK